MAANDKLKIRSRTLRGYRREAGGYAVWTEYQVVDGRKVISRHDLLDQAEAAVAKLRAERSE